MQNPNNQLSDRLYKAIQPLKICPLCGNNIKTKVSFKGRTMYRNKRKTQYCSCGWSKIIPTEREAMIELGEIDEEINIL